MRKILLSKYRILEILELSGMSREQLISELGITDQTFIRRNAKGWSVEQAENLAQKLGVTIAVLKPEL